MVWSCSSTWAACAIIILICLLASDAIWGRTFLLPLSSRAILSHCSICLDGTAGSLWCSLPSMKRPMAVNWLRWPAIILRCAWVPPGGFSIACWACAGSWLRWWRRRVCRSWPVLMMTRGRILRPRPATPSGAGSARTGWLDWSCRGLWMRRMRWRWLWIWPIAWPGRPTDWRNSPMFESLPFALVEPSVVTFENTTYALVNDETSGEDRLAISGSFGGFAGEMLAGEVLLAPLTPENARELRRRLPWLRPGVLGLRTSAGFGDRLGLATPGHVLAVRGTGVAPIFAQQSVRENTRTGRTPQQVVDDAMWGVLRAGWREPWGADADHLKRPEDIPSFVAAGYTFFTIDAGDYVDDKAETHEEGTLLSTVQALPWKDLQSSLDEMRARYLRRIEMDALSLEFSAQTLYRALAKYGRALVHMARMTRCLHEEIGQQPYELEISIDETDTPTSLPEHFFLVSECRRLHIPVQSLAPRFVGRFEKGVGYLGEVQELERNLAGHASIMRFFGNSYKLSMHTGSDKFEVYEPAMRSTGGLVHLKTAGTSYLEALRLIAALDSQLFRKIWDFARAHYEADRRTYHVSARMEDTLPAGSLADERLPDLLNQFAPRQVLHVTFGSVLETFGTQVQQVLRANRPAYDALR